MYVAEYGIDIVCMLPNVAKPDRITDAILSLHGAFTVFRKDRFPGYGGGVCILTKNYLNCINIKLQDKFQTCEITRHRHSFQITKRYE